MLSNHLILCQLLLLLPSVFPSIRVFSNEMALRIRWPKYWSFSISPSNEYSGLISFRIDWLDLLAVQGTLKSFLQHHSSKASILQRSAFFMIQLWHPYMSTGKTIGLTRQTFVGKVMSLLFNMLSAAKSLQSCPTLCDPIDSSPTRLPCPSPTPGVYSNSCTLSRWCHATIWSSVVLFSSHLQSFPASGSFQMSRFFTSGGKSIGVSASASVLPMNIRDWFPLGWTGWISMDSQVYSPTPQFKSINSLALNFLYSLTLTSIHD